MEIELEYLKMLEGRYEQWKEQQLKTWFLQEI